MSVEIKIPELGDNIESGVIVSILVNEGDTIENEQSLIELETDKAVIEVPSSSAGVVKKLLVKKGDEVKVGQAILQLDSNGQESTEKAAAEKEEQAKSDKDTIEKEEITDKEPEKSKEKPPSGQKEEKAEKEPQSASESETVEFKIPNVGDGVDKGTITSVYVKKGDNVKKDQALMEMETDKAVIEVPSDADGKVQEVLVKSGDTVSIGQKVFVLSTMVDVPAEKKDEVRQEAKQKPEKSQTEHFVPEQDINKEEIERRERESVAFTKGKKPDVSKLIPAAPSTRSGWTYFS